MKKLVHQHLLVQSTVAPCFEKTEENFKKFLDELLVHIGMKCLIPARVAKSEHNAWTGIVGIVTSHIAFHYWVDTKELQLDIYSCKKFDDHDAISFFTEWWCADKDDINALSVRRELGKNFDIVHMSPR